MSIRFNNFFINETVAGSVSGSTGMTSGTTNSKQDLIDSMMSDEPEIINLSPEKSEKETRDLKEIKEKDDDAVEIKEGKTKEDTEEELSEEEKELKLLEEELEDELEPTEEKLELVTPVARREILKKYPEIFKDFPYLEKAYYREQQFTEVFPTINEAKEAAEKAEVLASFENDLTTGNTERMLLAAKQEPEGFNKLVDNLLPTLAKVDSNAYHHILGNVIKHTIASMVQEAQASSNDVLRNAAQIVNQFVFGSSHYTPPSQLSNSNNNGQPKPDDTKARELAERERKLNEKEYNRHNDDITTKVTNSVKATIETNIDPKQTMTDYVRRNAVRDASETINNLIKKDNRFQQLLDRLWQRAKKDDYSRSSLDAIRSAHVSKAKTLLPSVIKKARNEALRGMGKRVSEDKEDEKTERSNTRERNTERSRSNNSSDKKDIPAHMSSLDFLMSDD